MIFLVSPLAVLALLTVLAAPTLAFPPGLGCLDADCERNWTSWKDTSAFCQNNTAIGVINSCIASSSCSESEKTDAYRGVAQACINADVVITAQPEATFSVTSDGSAWPSTWTSGAHPWGSGGPFGPGHGGGWGPWGSQGQWTSGPWTSWWNDNDRGPGHCPNRSWPGWTSGSWSSGAPWTSWTACTCYATSTTTVTATAGSGQPTTSVSYVYRVAEAASASSMSSTAAADTSNAAMPVSVGPGILVAGALAAVFAL